MDRATIGRRLRRARLAAGLSQARVAAAVDIPRPSVSLIESGQRSVSSVELAQLSRLYGKPASSFLFEPEEAPLLQYFRTAAPVAEADEALIAEAAEWCRYYAFLEEAAFGEQRYEFPTYPLPRGRAIDQGEHLAEQERRRLELGDGPIHSMVDLLEHQGIKVQVRAFSEDSEASGCYFLSEEMGPCILINRSELPSRRRFTAAHEYAHFLVDQDEVRAEVCAPARRQDLTEMRANAFAAALLLPAGGISSYLSELDVEPGEVGSEHVVHLMFHFGVSLQAVLWRLVNIGWISQDRREQLARTSVSRLAQALGYEGQEPGDMETEPDRFRQVAIEAWRADEISLGKLSELLGTSSADLRRLLSRPERQQERPARAPAAEPDWL